MRKTAPKGRDKSSVAPKARPADKKLTPSELKEIHEEAMRLADEAWLAEKENIRQGRDCQRFYAGGEGQWDDKARQERIKDGRPVLTINRLPQFVRQMTGDLRKNPPSLKFLPAKGEASQETAEAFNGITRHIEQQSNAKDCYIIATENAAIAGQGFFRVCTEYSSDDGFEQDIRIKPIRDPFGALLDPFAQLPDKSDIRYGFVFEHMSVKDFETTYPKFTAEDIPISTGETTYPWRSGDVVKLAEFWQRKAVKKTLILLDDGSIVEDEAKIPPGSVEVKRREVDGYEVCMYLVTGKDVISGPHYFPGRYIPICMVVGEEISQDGATVRKGMVHDARDPQRVYNYSRTASVEAVALQPKAPFILTADQVKGWESTWRTAGSKNHAYLVHNVDPRAPGLAPKRSDPAIASTGLDSQAMIAAEDMKAVIGIYDASLGAKSNEQSGVAIAQRQQEGDTTTYLYPDNLSRALSYLGRVMADVIPRVYDSERQIRILKEDGGTEMITVNATQEVPDERGKPVPLYDLSDGEYDVTVVTGPNFASRRAEARAHMIELAKGVPMVGQVAPDLIVENSDFPGADQISKRIKKALGIGEDGEPIEQPPQPPPPDVAAKALKDGAQADKLQAETQGIELNNAQMFLQLQTIAQNLPLILQQMQAMQEGGQAPMGPGGEPPPGGPVPAAAPEAPPMPPDAMGDDLPPMVEVESLGGPQP